MCLGSAVGSTNTFIFQFAASVGDMFAYIMPFAAVFVQISAD